MNRRDGRERHIGRRVKDRASLRRVSINARDELPKPRLDIFALKFHVFLASRLAACVSNPALITTVGTGLAAQNDVKCGDTETLTLSPNFAKDMFMRPAAPRSTLPVRN